MARRSPPARDSSASPAIATRPGVYEVPFGITVNELLDADRRRGMRRSCRSAARRAQCVAPKDFGRRIAFEDLATGGSVIVFGPGRDVLDVALQFTDFFVEETCGWCAPCRVGTTLLKKAAGKNRRRPRHDVGHRRHRRAGRHRARTSRCGLGQTAPNPILSTMRNFPEAYEAKLRSEDFVPDVTLEEALADAVRIQGRQPVSGEEHA